MKELTEFARSLVDPELVPTAIKVSLVVGSILFAINHGSAVMQGTMKRDRWISAGLTYLVPYMVNIHGQFISRNRRRDYP
jgi:hypothetical protein